jgi:phosphate uptake regulator
MIVEQRKVQRVGSSTLSVSLPKQWVDRVGVKQGDLVTINEEKNDDLRISTKVIHVDEPAAFVIHCDLIEEPNLLERLIIGSYVRGFDTVKVFSLKRIKGRQIEELRNVTQQLIGLSIMEETAKEVILQCSLDSAKFNIYSLIRRLATITSTMENEAFEALLSLNPELAEEVIKRERDANSIYRLTTRLLFSAQKTPQLAETIGLEELLDVTGVRLVTKNLEGIANSATRLATIAIELQALHDTNTFDKTELKKLVPLAQLEREAFRRAMESLFTRNIIAANTSINLRNKLIAALKARMRAAAIPYFRAVAIELTEIAKLSASIAIVAMSITIGKMTHFPS